MKTKNFFLMAFLAFATLGIASCSNDNEQEWNGKEDGSASLTIKITGNKPNSRAVEAGDISTDEATIHNFTAFVFNSFGILEGKTSTMGSNQAVVDNLTAGTGKKVVVVTNIPSEVTIPASIHYDWFSDLNNIVDLGHQNITSGITMSGEVSKDLVEGVNSAEVTVSRVVAKIKLNSVTISPETGHEKPFVLKHVHIMRAKGEATLGVPQVLTTNLLYGGTAAADLTQKSFLTEEFSNTDYTGRYFYVFPNDNTDGKATLLTLEGTYDGETRYYAVRINDKVINPNDGTGEYIKRNTLHTLNIVLKRPGNGTTDPELVPDPATLEVTVKVEPWSEIPDQNIEW